MTEARWSRLEKISVAVAIALVAVMVVPMARGNAMHIMEGYLPVQWCIAWGAMCIPFAVMGFFSIRKKVKANSKNLALLALCGAFAFVLSALKLPSVTGSCSHPTGVGLGAILFGPTAMSLIGIIILLFQALLLAHGGLTTLGANTFSMAIVGPFVAYGLFKLTKKLGGNSTLAVFLGSCLGALATYVVTAVQLGFAFPDPVGGIAGSMAKFMAIFALTQVPLSICEGLLTVLVFNVLKKYSSNELQQLAVI